MRTARARTSVEKRFPGFPLVMAYLSSFLLSGKPGLVQNFELGNDGATRTGTHVPKTRHDRVNPTCGLGG
jgi:hypothetical protein